MVENIEVYKAIVNVQSALAKEGIAKDRKCTQGATYNFRGIDDIYNHLAPYLAASNLCILPRMIERNCVERTSAKGNALFYTTVEAEFDFVSSIDGSCHTVRTFGEAMDSGDKGTNKAMSAAYKYAAFQTFCIPTEGDNDTENQTHVVQQNGGYPTTITEDQVNTIYAMMDEADLKDDVRSGFLKYVGVNSVEGIPASKYKTAVSALEAKIKSMVKA